jgi:ribonuclease P protein subunit RPR2|tara:strand:+ start:77 stop:379 length:303 start_codon:yes stop_codon:yes gene_type:complete
MKLSKKQIATERIQILITNAISNSKENYDLAQKQAALAKRLGMRYRIKLPYEIRLNFCKKCKQFIPPGIGSKIRIGRSNVKSIRITCYFCGHTYRKIIAQ